MFNPVAIDQEGIDTIRIGTKLPANSVGLAYVHSPPLDPSENVRVTDLSGFTLENTAGKGMRDEDLWPNDQGLLAAWDKNPRLKAKSFVLTNEFENGVPLYYAYDLTYPAMSRGDLVKAAESVQVQDHLGHHLPKERGYKVVAMRRSESSRYDIRVFTSFQVQPNEDLRVVYTASKDGRTIPGYAEKLSPSLAFTKHVNLEDVILFPNRQLLYYQAEGREVGESQLYVGSVPIRDLDHRQPVPFRYRLKARSFKDNNEYIATTPWVYDSLFHPNALSQADSHYQNGHKRLSNKIAIDIIAEFSEVEPFLDPEADVEFSVESSNAEVHTYTQGDGKNYILAHTDVPTGRILLPKEHRVENRSTDYHFSAMVSVDGAKPQVFPGKVSILEGHKKIAGPFEGDQIDVTLVRPYDPVNIYVKDNSLYVYTNETDVFYVPRFSMRTESNSQIRVLEPEVHSPDDNWYVRVRNGQFRRLSTDAGFRIDYHYSIPEYFRQDFDSTEGMPFKKALGEQARVIGDQKIRLMHKPLHIQKDKAPGSYNIELTVNGIPANLLAWDASEGTVDVDTRLSSSDEVLVSYFYEEHAFEYRGYFNPATQSFWHLDLNPGPGHVYDDHDSDTGEVRESNGFSLINRTVHLYMRPTAMFTEEQEMVRGSYRENALFHSFEESEEDGAILLAKIQVRPNSSADSLRIIDIRKNGGGIKQEITAKQQAEREPESKHYWDIANWDGEPYPENGLFIARVPTYILKDEGGRFSKEEVAKIVERHVGYGILPVIEYVEEPKEILSKPKSVQVEMIWKGGGA